MLEVRGLSVGYEGNDVVHDVDLDVAADEAVAVIGSNGAGKSTLLRAICGMLPASGGTVRFDGQDVTGTSTARLARLGLSYVPAERHLFPRMTVAENLTLGAYPDRPDESLRDEVHDLFPRLAERADQLAGTMSGGEQQMLALGRALLNDNRLLLIDEPTKGLAPNLVTEVADVLERMSGLTTSLLVEQNLGVVRRIAHHAIVLDHGEVVYSGDVAGLLDDPARTRELLGVGSGDATEGRRQ